MGDPVVSVVLTNYNGRRYVGQAIESVLAQTYSDWEMIIVDDASTDDSPELIRAYRDPRIRLVENARNGQVSYAHNVGNSLCRGKYIAALDNDDVWKPEKLARQVAWMEAHPETGACFTRLDLIDENGNSVSDPALEEVFQAENRSRQEWLHELLTHGNHFGNDTSLIRREVMEEIGGNNLSLIQLHDYDLWVRIACRHELYILPYVGLSYRRESDSSSITASNRRNIRRTYFEYTWLIGNTISDMPEALFRDVFWRELIRPDLTGPDAVLCEKALLLREKHPLINGKAFAFRLFEQILSRPESAELLREEFGFTQQDVYAMTAEPVSYDHMAAQDAAEGDSLRAEAERRGKSIPGKIGRKMRGGARKTVRLLKKHERFYTRAQWVKNAVRRGPGSATAQYRDYWETHSTKEEAPFRPSMTAAEKKAAPEIQQAVWKDGRLGEVSAEYAYFLEEGTVLHPDAAARMALEMERGGWDLLYADEKRFTDRPSDADEFLYKPDFSPETLRQGCVTGGFLAFRSALLRGTEPLNPGCPAYDLALKLSERTDRIGHVREILSASRKPGPDETRAMAEALSAHLKRLGLNGEPEGGAVPNTLRIRYAVEGEPQVSILILNRDHARDLSRCVESILRRTTWKNLEILILENGSAEESVFRLYDRLCAGDSRIRVLHTDRDEFNFSALCNEGARQARGAYLLLLNNDTEVISPSWIEEMLMYAQRPDTGAVGAKLYYPDGTIQHGGVLLGVGGVAAHAFRNCDGKSAGMMNRLVTAQEYSAVTGACMMVSAKAWQELGGMDEELKIAYNDVDFCLRAREKGMHVYWTPWAELYHLESKSRGLEDTAEKKERLLSEETAFRKKWQPVLDEGDPFYHPRLTTRKEDFSVKGREGAPL